MREIKFRGRWNGKWVYGGIEIRHNGEILIGGNGVWSVVDGKTVGQYIGLKDKNGKEIYEGDLINLPTWDPHTAEVVFNRGAFCFRFAPSDAFYHDIKYVEDAEVIGNVYEKPDLCPTS